MSISSGPPKAREVILSAKCPKSIDLSNFPVSGSMTKIFQRNKKHFYFFVRWLEKRNSIAQANVELRGKVIELYKVIFICLRQMSHRVPRK